MGGLDNGHGLWFTRQANKRADEAAGDAAARVALPEEVVDDYKRPITQATAILKRAAVAVIAATDLANEGPVPARVPRPQRRVALPTALQQSRHWFQETNAVGRFKCNQCSLVLPRTRTAQWLRRNPCL